MAVFKPTDDPRFVMDESGRYIPKDSVDPADISSGPSPGPSVVQTPDAKEATNNAPQYNRSKLDELQTGLSKIKGYMQAIASSKRQFSQAEAAGNQAMNEAASSALGAARGGVRDSSGRRAPGTGDAAFSKAIGGGAAAEMAAASSASSARATEEANDTKFRLDALKAAGELGLNQAALEVKVENLNMAAATDYLNNLFADNRQQAQISEQQAGRIMGAMKDLALLEQDYYAMDLQDQNALQDRILNRWGIDEGLRNGIKAIEANGTSPSDVLFGGAQVAGGAYARYLGTKKPEANEPLPASNPTYTGKPSTVSSVSPIGVGGNY